MHSEVKESSNQESLHCKPYLQDLDKLFDLFQEKHEAIQQFCGRELEQVKNICNVLVNALAIPHFQLTIKQKAASLLKTFLKYQTHNFHFIVQQHYAIFFNFSIQAKVKRIFSDSLFSLITKYTNELDGLFENSTHTLLNLLEKLSSHSNLASSIYTAPPISVSTLPEPFSFSIQWPRDQAQIFWTLIILGDVFLGNDTHPNVNYKAELANLFRRVNKLLLTEEGLSNHLKEVDQLLDFWIGLATESVVDEDDEPRRSRNEEEDQLKDRRMAGVMQMKSWGQFYDQLELVLDFLAPSQQFAEIPLTLHNYLTITQNWEQHGIFSLKSKAAQIISTLLQLIQAVDYRECQSNQSLAELAIRLQWSIFQSLQALIKGPQINLKNLEIGSNLLELFSTLLSTHPRTFSDAQIIDLLGNSIIPIFDFYLVETKDLFMQNVQECLAELEDCCQDHSRGTILGQLAKMVEAICDQNQAALQFLMQYIRYSLQQRQNAQFQSWTVSKSVLEFKASSADAALLLLGVISYKSATISSYKEALKKIFVRPFIDSLSDFQKGLFYNCMGYIMVDLYWDDEQGLEDILMSTLEPMGCQLRYFAVNLMSQTQVKFFNQKFISEFLNNFMDLGDWDQKWIVLTHLVGERLQDFDESYLQSLISRVKEEVINESENILCLMNQGKKYNTAQVGNLLYFCLHVAEIHQYCLKHPNLQEALWSVVETLPTVSQLFLDDILVKIATELLTPITRLPNNFVNILTAVSQTFSCSEFEGVHFYAFLQTAILASGADQKNIIDLIYLSLSEVFSYVLYFPEEKTFEMILNLSNTIVSLQCLFLRHPKSLDAIQIDQIQKLCLETLQRDIFLEMRDYPLVEGRTVILLLLTQIMKGEKLMLDTILIKANQHCFMEEDALLLLYILRENLRLINADSRHNVFIVVIYCMRTEQHKKALKSREDYIKLHNIYNYVEKPIKLQDRLSAQAKSLLHHFQTTMPQQYHFSFSKLRQSDVESLWSLLQDNNPPSRKILRVMGPSRGLAPQVDEQSEYRPFIRGAAETWGDSEEGQSRKRRKEKQVTKYEMVKIKRERKGT